ncbi:phytoene desaturase [Kineosphaera limosa]|uniref:Phytoene dehydrogenase n=1 Tax=Kineosphaera limosa NBRC 100340 TaxID=1184609 RepID=K6WWC2_9MICO|nr:phytoene desaturase family protein [Kineosphaera limosa]NYE01966.1 phytoene desaturase [Kineosphaera limosa]GAB98141.1 phytoene dehydrogenase [Kineosphaera limosa NBRC 100340]
MAHVVVIGAGLAGLSAAAHLQGQGHEVSVVEAQAGPGGRGIAVQRNGFTFDTGPTVLTMTNLLDDTLAPLGRTAADTFDLHLLDPAYRACFADGSTLHIRHGHEAMRAEIARECGSEDAAAFDEFVTWLRALYEVEVPHFIDVNFDSPADLLRNPGAMARLVRLGGFGRLGPAIRRRFRDERLHRIFSFQAMYAGLAPEQALAIYAVITYMDSIEGVWFPRGGMRAVPELLAAVLQEAGVEFRYGAPVTRILTRPDGAVAGVHIARVSGAERAGDDWAGAGERLACDAVVCTIDVPTAYDRLLPDLTPPVAVQRPRYSPSAVVWHVGVRGGPEAMPQAAHHNIHFGRQWAQCFEDLLVAGTRMRDPSRLVSVPSLDDPSAAPAGHSTLYVLEPVPNLAVGHVDWATERPAMRAELEAFLDANGYPTHVVAEHLVDPTDWARAGMAAGTPFALAHTFAQTGPFRPSNVERRRPGLFFAGSGTIPGVGVPMVLISGKLAARRVASYLPTPGLPR